MEFELTSGQKDGLAMVRRIAATPKSCGVIKGFAGTGKTTLLKVVLEELKDVVLLAPTGKAASRMSEVTNVRASTIHRWMYTVMTDPVSRQPVFVMREFTDMRIPSSNLVVVDEASMVGPDEYGDLLEFQAALGFSILFVGDGFQLPPVQKPGDDPFSILADGFLPAQNTVELREITRQALDSPIIRATLSIREGDAGDALMDLDLIMPEDLEERLRTHQDMVICWKNETRHAMNALIRKVRSIDNGLRTGEPLLILKNNYNLDIYNGEIHTFGGYVDNLGVKEVSVFIDNVRKVVPLRFSTALLHDVEVVLCLDVIEGKYDKISVASLEKAVAYWQSQRGLSYVHANQGYTLTCHKAQGSEAESVLVCLEKSMLQRLATLEGRRWLYTATSRARKELAITYI